MRSAHSSEATARLAIAINLLDDRCGIVGGLERVPVREPWHLYQATISEPLWNLRPEGGRVAAGCSINRRQAQASAVGEAVERYCSMHADPARLRRSSHRELSDQHERAIDPLDLQLSCTESDAELTRETKCDWVQGTDRHGPCWVPAALAWTEPGPHARTADGQPYSAPHSQGIALAPSRARARTHAVGEVIERHALATAWHLRLGFRELEADRGVRRWFVPNRWKAPVVLAAIVEPGWVSAGCAFGQSIEQAADKASAEAVMMSRTMSLAASDDTPWATRSGPVDPSGALDLLDHAAVCREPSVRRRQIDRLCGDAKRTVGHSPAWADPALQTDVHTVDPDVALAATGLDPVTIDLTTAEVAEAGWSVVRVVVPGLRVAAPSGYVPPSGGIDPLPPEFDLTPIPVI